MVPASSHKVSRVSWYSGYCCPHSVFAYGAFTLSGRSFQDRSANLVRNVCSPNPSMHAHWFGLFRFRSPLLTESHVVFSSSGYLDVSVHRVPSAYLWIQYTVTEVCSAGFPHSDICGSRDICSSPQLFAAYRVFHRLLVPRHPPCALYSLTCCNSSFMVSLPAYIALYAFLFEIFISFLLVLDVFSFIFFYPVGSYKPTF